MNASEFMTTLSSRPSVPTREQIAAAIKATAAISEAIRAAGRIPSGVLYAQVMNVIDLRGYEWILDRLVGAGLVNRSASHELAWIGPTLEDAAHA